MEAVDVYCDNDNCGHIFNYEYESESGGVGTTHQAVCPRCGMMTEFELEYTPIASNERLIEN